jgi:hypothetical protein
MKRETMPRTCHDLLPGDSFPSRKRTAKLRKAIAYAYPTSARAAELGAPGYFVQQSRLREDGTWSPPYVAQGCHDVFADRQDPDLLQLFAEADGEQCPHGNVG